MNTDEQDTMSLLRKVQDIVSFWDAMVFVGVAYVLFNIPLEIVFGHHPSKMEVGIDLAISAVFSWYFLTAEKKQLIARFPIAIKAGHVMTCLPIMSIATGLTGFQAHWTIYLQSFHVFILPHIVVKINERSKNHLIPKRLKVAATALVSFIFLNWFACGWLIIYPPGPDKTTDYIKAAYWLITTIATVGYGDVTPTTNIGRCYAMCIMILGATIWGMMIASASRLMLASDRRKEKKKEKLEALHSFFKHYDVPKSLQTEVLGFYSHLLSRKISDDEHAVLNELPVAIQSRLQTYMNLRPISRVSLFKGVSFECLSDAANKLELGFFAPGEKIFTKGESGEEMYLIGHGSVVVHIGDHLITNLGEGSCFGELALIGDGLRTTDVTASTYCDVFKLSKQKFGELFNSHRDLRENIEKLARDRQLNSTIPATAAKTEIPQTKSPQKLAS